MDKENSKAVAFADTLLTDALEAVFAAIFLDRDFTQAQRAILSLFKNRLTDETLDANSRDAKTIYGIKPKQ